MAKFKIIEEGEAKVQVPTETKVSKDLPVFYNPVMKFNRDISVILINTLEKDNLKVALPMAGTGVRGIRLLKETKNIDTVFFNDGSPEATELIKTNLALNNIKEKAEVFNHEASRFLFNLNPSDYIDIDPFGSPNSFLDAAVKKVSLGGIIAITATDTSCLCGAYTKPCIRKYWARPMNNYLMHETGLRILIRKVQLIAAQYERALTPIISYSKDHYVRIFLRCEKGKKKVDAILKQHDFLKEAGPLWLGKLHDEELLTKMLEFVNKNKDYEDTIPFIQLLQDESQEPFNSIPGFFDIHAFSKRLKISVPKTETITKEIQKTNKVTRTHFSLTGLKTDMKEEDFERLLRRLN